MEKITIGIPCYNCEQTIDTVIGEITRLFGGQSEYDYQVVLVNDGSADGTAEAIARLCGENTRITGINLMKNFGQEIAKLSMLPYVAGQYLVFMDDDGQHPASFIFPMIARIKAGDDVVIARFAHKEHSAFRRLASRLNYAMLHVTVGLPRDIAMSSYFAVSEAVIAMLRQYRSPFPFLFGYLLQVTGRLSNIDMPHNPRLAGTSGYTLRKLLRLWLNAMTSFSAVPLRAASVMGGLFALVGFASALVIIIRKLIDPTMPVGYASTMAVLLLVGGILMVILGILGEYVGRMFMTLSDKPQYAIRTVTNAPEDRPKQ